ncbi:acetylornithine aminotransferase/acetylornithine/N-succinyldiaminopimelate aminotransferase [Caldicoprobacter guelmensis]|uniref:acetylornithine transaminase n=1 Tax=Caldicoprobacter guelmensis TaxID=1170224 RepID=UPI00195CD872|nr:acetylornithine transaminase [Caldicoprobacter guelmensis]MBM7582155.1 acetylornithine aminotransferase/acetylornithine/N-succinyldiaminopimelate aminotransferase [Caldicoprobacter guelmensis]
MDIQEIIALDKKYYMNTFGDRLPVAFEYGQQSTLYDKEGKAYIDFVAGIAVNVLGYGHPALVEAIISQAKKLIHCSNLFYIEAQAQLAKLLVENSCGDRVFFANSGAEANEGAIKLARKYFWDKGVNKYEIITAINSFHGRTLATLAATGQEKYQRPFVPMPPGFKSIPYNDLEALKSAITDTTCAIMLELIQGEGGVIEATYEYVKGVEQLCKEKGILLILDEVQTGMGRTGKLFAYQHFGIQPDIITLAKGLGGGVPIGAIIAKESAASAFEPGSHGSTFGGNPLACAAATAVITTLLNEGLIDRCAQLGEYFKQRLLYLKDKYPFIKDVRGKGLMLGMELDPSIPGKEIVKEALNHGYIINCAGHNTLRFVPPLVITQQEIDGLIDALEQIFTNTYR